MMQTNHPAIDVLDQMHRAILNAQFDELAQLTPLLEASLPKMDTIENKQILARIHARANRNAACLTAAARGVRAAQRRLKDLQTMGDGFSTYDGRGRRAQHGQPSNLALRY
jgi:hypothetical protein